MGNNKYNKMRSILSLAVIALISTSQAKNLKQLPHEAPIGYIMMQDEPAAEPAAAAAPAAEGASAAPAEGAPSTAATKGPETAEGAAAAKAPKSDGYSVDNSIPNGGYEGMVGGRSTLNKESLDLPN